MGPGGTARPAITRVRVRVPTTVARAHAAAAARRAVGGLGVAGADVVLAAGRRRLVVGDVRWSPHADHPAARRLASLHGHVVDAERRLLAPAELELRIVDDRLELHGEVPCDDAARALSTGLRLLARELAGWQDVLVQLDA